MAKQFTDRVVGRYRVQRLLAEGGMGRVLLARTDGPAGFTKLVVLKTLHPHLAADAGALETFLVEARVTAALFHPNVAQVFELVEEGGEYFLAMEYVRGRSLRELLAARPRLPLPIALSITSQVLRALQHAHEAKDDRGRPLHVLHRDVSAENVLVSWEGAVKLVDFGLAGATRRAGKAGYLAPEVLEGAAPSVASDLYATGVLLAECLAGPTAFTESGAPAPWASEVWGPVVAQALEVAPEKRFGSAAAFADALDALARAAGDHVTQASLAHMLHEVFGAPDDELVSAVPARRTALLTQAPGRTADPAPPAAPAAPPARAGPSPRLAALVGVALVVAGAVLVGGRGQPSTAGAPLVETTPAPGPPGRARPPGDELPPLPRPPVRPEGDRTGARALRDPASGARPEPTLPSAAPRVATEQLADATLDVRVIPWAEVVVDGRALGTTPLAPLRLSRGPHVLELKNPALGVAVSRRVTLESGSSQRLQVDLLDELAGQ